MQGRGKKGREEGRKAGKRKEMQGRGKKCREEGRNAGKREERQGRGKKGSFELMIEICLCETAKSIRKEAQHETLCRTGHLG